MQEYCCSNHLTPQLLIFLRVNWILKPSRHITRHTIPAWSFICLPNKAQLQSVLSTARNASSEALALDPSLAKPCACQFVWPKTPKQVSYAWEASELYMMVMMVVERTVNLEKKVYKKKDQGKPLGLLKVQAARTRADSTLWNGEEKRCCATCSSCTAWEKKAKASWTLSTEEDEGCTVAGNNVQRAGYGSITCGWRKSGWTSVSWEGDEPYSGRYSCSQCSNSGAFIDVGKSNRIGECNQDSQRTKCVYRRRPNAFSDLEVSSLVMVIIWWPKISGGAGEGWSTKGWPSWYFDIYNRGEGAQRKTLHGVGNSPERSMFQHGQGWNEG